MPTLLFVLWLFVACGGTTPQQQSPLRGQRIVLGAASDDTNRCDTVRFGRLHEGEIAVKELVLCNASDHPIVIIDYERTCGCTTLEYDSQPLMSGEERTVRLLFDARGTWGWQLKQLTLHLADGEQPRRLLVEADIE